jgi:hypothetical protein
MSKGLEEITEVYPKAFVLVFSILTSGGGQKHNGLLVSQSMVNWGCADTLSMLARTLRQFGIRRLNIRSKLIRARDTQDAGDAIHPPRDCCFTSWSSAPWDCHTSQCNKLTGCFRSSNLTGGDNQDLDACHALGAYKPVVYSGRRYVRNPLPHFFFWG